MKNSKSRLEAIPHVMIDNNAKNCPPPNISLLDLHYLFRMRFCQLIDQFILDVTVYFVFL